LCLAVLGFELVGVAGFEAGDHSHRQRDAPFIVGLVQYDTGACASNVTRSRRGGAGDKAAAIAPQADAIFFVRDVNPLRL
jgi:hypothetical protein